MTFVAEPLVLCIGVVDALRVVGTSGIDVSWASLGMRAPGGARAFRALFGRSDDTFRRLDCASRALVLAGCAAGLEDSLPAGSAVDVGIVVETSYGSLDADLRFAASMSAGFCDGAVFPYTLPSTALGELALRHGLRGPTVCLSILQGQRGTALREAELLLATGECQFVVAAQVDALETPCADASLGCEAVLALLASPSVGARAVAPWPGTREGAFRMLARSVTA